MIFASKQHNQSAIVISCRIRKTLNTQTSTTAFCYSLANLGTNEALPIRSFFLHIPSSGRFFAPLQHALVKSSTASRLAGGIVSLSFQKQCFKPKKPAVNDSAPLELLSTKTTSKIQLLSMPPNLLLSNFPKKNPKTLRTRSLPHRNHPTTASLPPSRGSDPPQPPTSSIQSCSAPRRPWWNTSSAVRSDVWRKRPRGSSVLVCFFLVFSFFCWAVLCLQNQ